MRKISFIAVAAALACGGSNNNTPSNVYVATTMTSAAEVPTPPNPNPGASGNATFTVNADNTVSYSITYAGLSGPPTLAHIHAAAAGTSGGVVTPVLLPTPKPTTTSGTVTGSFAASDIQAGAGGIVKGDLNSLVAAMKAGNTYANVHTAANPAGEIRGQIAPK